MTVHAEETTTEITGPKILTPPDEVVTEMRELVTVTSGPLAIKDNADLARIDGIRDRANRVVRTIEDLYAPEKRARHLAHKEVCDEERFMLSGPAAVVAACDRVMKPYLREQELERQRQIRALEEQRRRDEQVRRQAAIDAAKREADERARQEREYAEKRAAEEREAAKARANDVEAAAMRDADALLAEGKDTEAQAVLDDAQRRRDNLLEDGEETARTVVAEAADVVERVNTETAALVADLAMAPVERVLVEAPEGPKLAKSSAAKGFKCDRTKAVVPANKLKAMQFVVAEALRGNWAPMAWFEHNFGQIDASARQMREMFPAEADCGIDVGLTMTIRSKAGGGAA
jgi:hypothetical protein